MNLSEILDRAADLIEERGWTVGMLGWDEAGDRSNLCLEGGIAAALGMRPDPRTGWLPLTELMACPAYKAVAAYLEVPKLWAWNDMTDGRGNYIRTATEVVGVLRAVAVVEAARESVAVTA